MKMLLDEELAALLAARDERDRLHALVNSPQTGEFLEAVRAEKAHQIERWGAAHAGVSPTSGGYFNNLGRLRSSGHIEYPTGGTVALTAAGRAIANKPDKAPTLEDLHASWLAIVPAPQAAILQVLLEVYPAALAKDDLADRVGVSRTSGGYFNNLGRLRTLGAIDYPQKGTAAATALLFPKGKA